jgi:hypothetical protein
VRKLILASAMLAALAYSGTASGSDPISTPGPASQEGCVSQPGDTCTYTTTRTGGFAARGTWTLTVSVPAAAPVPPATCDARDVNCDGKWTYTFTESSTPAMPQGCSLFGPGATVTTLAGASGGIAAGNPFPAPSDGGVPNECAGGRLPDRTDVSPT